MGKLDAIIKSEILRLSRREIRPIVQPLQKRVRSLSRQLRTLSQQLGRMTRTLAQAQKGAPAGNIPAPAESEVEGARISAGLVKKLRKRLGITQPQMAKLVGVSAAAVQSWEQGIARPAGANKTAVVALRKLGRRDVQQLLQRKDTENGGSRRRGRKPRTARKAAATRKTAGRKRGRRRSRAA